MYKIGQKAGLVADRQSRVVVRAPKIMGRGRSVKGGKETSEKKQRQRSP